MALSNASSITLQRRVVSTTLTLNVCTCKRTTFLVFSLTAYFIFVHVNVLVWWKLQIRWYYCKWRYRSGILWHDNLNWKLLMLLRSIQRELLNSNWSVVILRRTVNCYCVFRCLFKRRMLGLNTSTTSLIILRTNRSICGITCNGPSVLRHVPEV